ncbi:RNA helicase [Tilletia horrida]|uniref:RNA helicase n=1 Tax=Tilletia horrida TaxID=155126 RepID=A0AAN6JTU4_9BASI|nr:RNA helicase [Tilletia horrida]KAK0569338.1 RNA helicase [Tilletia horrida]
MIHAQLGPKAKPTHVQQLSLQHFFFPSSTDRGNNQQTKTDTTPPRLKANTYSPTQTLIAAETGSGKTIAYLLPLLHHLKATEHISQPALSSPLLQPRAIILAPTHELARQLAAAAKNLSHIDKLKVLCLSSGGWLDTLKAGTAQLANAQHHSTHQPYKHPDIIVSTPSRLLSTLSNSRQLNTILDDADAVAQLRRTGRLTPAQRQRIRSQQASIQTNTAASSAARQERPAFISLTQVQSVVVDEADVLLAPDFGPSTRAVLHLARKEQAVTIEQPEEQHASSSKLTLDDITNTSQQHKNGSSDPVNPPESAADDFPFDLVLATATVPTFLAAYLRTSYPNIITLASNRLHRLPSRLKADFVNPGGNKMAAVAAQIRKALSEPPTATLSPTEQGGGDIENKQKNKRVIKNKILIFMNRTKSVELLSDYLTQNGIGNVAVTSSAEGRSKKSNAHIKAFLREKSLTDRRAARSDVESQQLNEETGELEQLPLSNNPPPKDHNNNIQDEDDAPRVLITTSLLSRGLDFDPSVTHVFLPDRIAYSTSGFGARRLATAMPGVSTSSPENARGASAASTSVAGINELELLHRAGRAARAGQSGRVVIFDKRAASALSSGGGGGGGDGGGAEKTRAKRAMVRNKVGKWVPKAAPPLRKAVRGLLVPKNRPAPTTWTPAPTMDRRGGFVGGKRSAYEGRPASGARIATRNGSAPVPASHQARSSPSFVFSQRQSKARASK